MAAQLRRSRRAWRYDNAAAVARKAHAEGMTLEQAALELGLVTKEEFEAWVRPGAMIGPRDGS